MGNTFTYIGNNLWGILGTLVSLIGLSIAIKQLFKISSRTKTIDETYQNTIKQLENKDSIENTVLALNKIDVIKTKLRKNEFDELLLDLTPLAKILVTLQLSVKSKIEDIDFEKYIELCSNLEVKIATETKTMIKKISRTELLSFNKLELELTRIRDRLKYQNNKNE